MHTAGEEPLFIHDDWMRVGTCAVGEKERIAIPVSEVHEPSVIGGPGWCRGTLAQERARGAASQRHEPLRRARIARFREPDLRAVAREADGSQNRIRSTQWPAIPSQIQKLARAHLADPEVHLTVMVRDERHEFSVWRDLRTRFRSLPIRQAG